jgi:FkbM family methyltransferase
MSLPAACRRIGYAFRLAATRPRLLQRKLTWRLRRLVAPRAGVRTWAVGGGVRFRADLGEDPAIRMMYCGAYDLELVQLLHDVLREGDTVIDIGASIGYISAVALGRVGIRGTVHSFEPDPVAADALEALAAANPSHALVVNRIALSDGSGTAVLSVASGNIGWKTLVPGFMPDAVRTVTVPLTTFDAYAEARGLRDVRLIKIDTEGYEYHVLRGMRGFLARTSHLPLIACEVAPSAFARLGHDAAALERLIAELGYRVADRTAWGTTVAIGSLTRTSDVILVPLRGWR